MPIVEKVAKNMGFNCVKLFIILTLNQSKIWGDNVFFLT